MCARLVIVLPVLTVACAQSNLRGERIEFVDAIWWEGSTNIYGQTVHLLLTTVPDACATYSALARLDLDQPRAPQDGPELDIYLDEWGQSMPSRVTEAWLATSIDDVHALSGHKSTISPIPSNGLEISRTALFLVDIAASPDRNWQPSMGEEDGYMEYSRAHDGTFKVTRQSDETISGTIDTDIYAPDNLPFEATEDEFILRGHLNERFTATYCPEMED